MSSKSDMYDKYGDIIPDGYTVSDKTKDMLNKHPIDWRIPDSYGEGLDYKSPIELIAGNLQTRIENDAVKVVQSYGFNVDKAELEKALKYDRDQYDKGYADARKKYERPTGHWESVGFVGMKYAWFRCSKCHKTTKIYMDSSNDFCCITDIRKKAVACLYCGAYMEGGRE
jgi:hypothetical protein